MKRLIIFVAWSIALSFVFYEIADFLTPGSPSAEVTLLLAGMAVVLVWLGHCAFRMSRTKKDGAHAMH